MFGTAAVKATTNQEMTVEIESILQHEEIQGLLENAEGIGSVRQPELADLIEAHQLDALETDALFNELERRGIDVVVEEPEREKEKEPAPPPLQTSYETTTDALQLFLREGGPSAVNGRAGGRAREAHRAWRHGREVAHDPVETSGPHRG